jgi:tetratricopeptide (TPR) repeat protein
VKLDPNLSESRTALAQILLAEGSAALAIEQAQAALQLNPRNITAAVTLGDAFLDKGDLPKGKSVFDSMSKVLPKYAVIHHRLGLIALAEKKEEDALEHFEAALDTDPNHIESLAQIVNISFAHKKTAEARDRIARQLDRSPDNPKLHILMGRAWLALQDVSKAETSLKKAIALDEKSLDAYILLSALYVQAGKLDQAMQENEAALAKNPKAIVPRMILGMLHTQRKEYDRAMARYEEALKINPRFVQAANNLAYLLNEHGGNSDQALTYAQTAREISPDDPHIADTLGWIFYRKNTFLRSVSLLKEAVLKLPQSPDVQFHYGMAEWKNGNTAAAKKALETALKLSQTFSGADEARTTLRQLERG